MDSVFKTKVEETEQQEHTAVSKNEPQAIANDNVETPYLDTPGFLDKYFGIGSEWHDRDQNFYPEVKAIDSYIQDKIGLGEIANNQKAVRDMLTGMEKLNNLKNETRSVVKLEVLSNYIEFLRKNDHLKSNLRRYG